MIKRTIFHIDINAFFPSVEVIYQPQLANQPFAVGKELRGVICSANYVARTKGVKAGIPCFKAKQLCPNLILIPPHFDLYNQYHQAFVHLLRSRFSNLIEVASIDECYLDVSRMLTAKLTPTILAKQIQDTIQRELCLGVSIGISYNRFLAKMGSNYRKPMGLTVINSEEDIKKLLWTLPIEKFYMIGPATAKILHTHDIHSIGDFAQASPELIKTLLNKNYLWYLHNIWGWDNTGVNTAVLPNKDISTTYLFLEDTNNYEVIIDKLRDLCSEIVSRTTDLAATFQTIVLKVRTTDFKWLSKSRTLAIPINTFSDLYFHIAELYESNYEGLKIRSVSVGIKKIIYTLVDKEVNTTDELVKQINHKFGKDVVFTGDMLPNGKKV